MHGGFDIWLGKNGQGFRASQADLSRSRLSRMGNATNSPPPELPHLLCHLQRRSHSIELGSHLSTAGISTYLPYSGCMYIQRGFDRYRYRGTYLAPLISSLSIVCTSKVVRYRSRCLAHALTASYRKANMSVYYMHPTLGIQVCRATTFSDLDSLSYEVRPDALVPPKG